MTKLIGAILMAVTLSLSACASQAQSQQAQTMEELPENPLRFMFGEWTGTAKGVGFDRQPYEITQTERVGPMLDGDITIIEGRGYEASGDLKFNAFAVISYDKRADKWEIRSYNDGRSGTFPFELTDNGYVWSIPAGPNAIMRFTAEFEGDSWYSIGEYVPAEGPASKTFEMNLKRIGDTPWPSAGAVQPPR
jgi:hypothetical protein